MAKGVNKCIFIGNLGKDPECKYTGGGTPVAHFSLAVNERKKVGDDWKDAVEWVNVVCWSKLAEIVGEYCKKGSQIYVEGRLQTSSWDDRQTGAKKYKTEVVASQIILLNGKGESQGYYSHAEHVSDEAVAAGSRRSASLEVTDEDTIPF